MSSRVFWRQGSRAVDPDTGIGARAAAEHRHLRRPPIPIDISPVSRPRVVAEQRARPHGEHGGKPTTFVGDGSVAKRVDAAVKRVEPTGRHPPTDRRRSHADVEELAAGYEPVLRARYARDRTLNGSRSLFVSLSEINSDRGGRAGGHGRSVAARRARMARRMWRKAGRACVSRRPGGPSAGRSGCERRPRRRSPGPRSARRSGPGGRHRARR